MEAHGSERAEVDADDQRAVRRSRSTRAVWGGLPAITHVSTSPSGDGRACWPRGRRREVLGRVSVRTSRLGRSVLLRSGLSGSFDALRYLAHVLLSGVGGLLMLQLLDLARENAALKCELARIRREAEALQRLLQTSEAGSDPERVGRVAPTDPSRSLLQTPGGYWGLRLV